MGVAHTFLFECNASMTNLGQSPISLLHIEFVDDRRYPEMLDFQLPTRYSFGFGVHVLPCSFF